MLLSTTIIGAGMQLPSLWAKATAIVLPPWPAKLLVLFYSAFIQVFLRGLSADPVFTNMTVARITPAYNVIIPLHHTHWKHDDADTAQPWVTESSGRKARRVAKTNFDIPSAMDKSLGIEELEALAQQDASPVPG
ncbi:hypothetical protein CkaCkLH20_13031 [Colletotrichum karsti]|uniref:Uncharacterized protein n=1 Tax=Colletotrichum karsti TaxID=1095194 RepID=A0A9P6HSC3_9PEZI|nr:uncharacterized protein CkaCkLH20_13031 [Colletotrichum karsti]KAF9869493.1 hypothetical protein CkaCkLH20_13031 [Colletotrichum karsti]